ncbi:MAG TPA: NAD(P)-dependent oxidoreductase [Bacteroidota bacterium]|nr:NAD(P)-dependent oxidoreductase [Bacteroidota bacterium]
MKIGIIGGNGFVGSGIRRALERRHHCNVITRDNYDALRTTRFDVVINANGNSKKFLAAQEPREEFLASVVSVQRSLLDFPADLYVHCSSVDVYPDCSSPETTREDARIDPERLSLYGFHKYLAEQCVRRYAPRWLILRFGGFVGPGLKKNPVYDILHGEPLRVSVDSAYQYLPTVAAGEALDALLTAGVRNELFNVCGEGCVPLRDIAAQIPSYTVRYAAGTPRAERYEVAISKIAAYYKVPASAATVSAFLRSAGAASASPPGTGR